MDAKDVYKFIQDIIDYADSESAGHALIELAGILSREPGNKDICDKIRDLGWAFVGDDLNIEVYRSATVGSRPMCEEQLDHMVEIYRDLKAKREEEYRRYGRC